MKKVWLAVGILIGIAIYGIRLRNETKVLSPEAKAVYATNNLELVVFYSRPFKKGREIFGGLVPYGKKWIGLCGFDFLIDRTRSETTSIPGGQGLTIETFSKGWGIGPRFGLLFRLSEKILLGTDAACYFRSFNSKQAFPDQPQSTKKSTTFNITMPAALFLTVRLKD